ncbi:MAG: hypothetical protein K2L18_00315, partial [Acetatifactor sp.]|nr:hypothetical protein [Acetatifactor sp.]
MPGVRGEAEVEEHYTDEFETGEIDNMGDMVKITDLKCPSCGSTLKMPAGSAKKVQCEYCGNEYVIDAGSAPGQGNPAGNSGARPTPQWQPAPQWQPSSPQSSTPESTGVHPVVRWIVLVICFVGLVALKVYRRMPDREAQRQRTQSEVMESIAASVNIYNPVAENNEEEAEELSGMLEQMVAAAFGKDAASVTREELARIQWIADKGDFDNAYIGYSFDNPLENPDAELQWLTFPARSDRGYSGLYMFEGLKKLETSQSLSQCSLQGLSLESLSASFSNLEDVAEALDDPSAIRQLSLGSSVKSLNGLDLFPNLESLIIDVDDMSDVNAVVALKQLKSLTLEDADNISDFAVFASMESLEELNIESENLKALEFLSRIPQLKSLSLADGKLLSLDGIEALEGLEKLSVKDCRELKNMDAITALTGLKELYLQKPYGCEEPSLVGLTKLQSLTLDNFYSCAFLSDLTELEELTLRSCDIPSKL